MPRRGVRVFLLISVCHSLRDGLFMRALLLLRPRAIGAVLNVIGWLDVHVVVPFLQLFSDGKASLTVHLVFLSSLNGESTKVSSLGIDSGIELLLLSLEALRQNMNFLLLEIDFMLQGLKFQITLFLMVVHLLFRILKPVLILVCLPLGLL